MSNTFMSKCSKCGKYGAAFVTDTEAKEKLCNDCWQDYKKEESNKAKPTE
jgi:recombinational DNA repair protein (RecF pathway)